MTRTAWVVTLVAALVVAAAPAAAETGAGSSPLPRAKGSGALGPGVMEALETDGEVAVLISFDIPSGAADASTAGSLARLHRTVGTVQRELLDMVAEPAGQTSEPAAAGFEVRRRFEAVPALAATLRSRSALDLVLGHRSVISVDLDGGGTGSLATSVPFIGADARHAVGNDGDGVVVAVLDSGADLDHPDLVDDILTDQACFGDNDGLIDGSGFCPDGSDRQTGPGSAEDDAGHGTHVTGIVTSAGTVSAPGAAPGAEIVSIKVTDDCTFAGCFYFFSEIVAAWDWVITNNAALGVDVMNMSLITSAQFSGDCDTSFPAGATAVATLRSIGITLFASAGNSGGTQMSAPACLSEVVAVGATDNADNVAPFSDSNASTDVFAPGTDVVSLAIGGGTTTASGTSMASPHAAGCAALLIEAGEATTPAAIETRLETSPFQVTDPAGLTFPRIDCSPDGDGEPQADMGGPYATDEGSDVVLDASGSSDPDGDAVTIAWDLDDDGAYDDAIGPSATFDRVGQDGVFTVGIEVGDPDGLVATAETTVTVANVAPSPSANADSPTAEGAAVEVTGSVTDPGWLDPLAATIDWGDGSPAETVTGMLESTRPDATLSFQASHVYGDDGSFTAEVCGSDDDTTTCQTLVVTVDNVAPTATIDTTTAVGLPGGPAIVTTAGEPLTIVGTVTDPGSDDLEVAWDWDDGPPTPDVITEYRNDPAAPDPFPSPDLNPRAVTDEQQHVFPAPCLYRIELTALDDDGGTAGDTAAVAVVGTDDRIRSAGHWYRLVRRHRRSHAPDRATLACFLDVVDHASSVFSEARPAAHVGDARRILSRRSAARRAAHELDRQLLAAWLNVASGALPLAAEIDLDGDGVPDTTLAEALDVAETTRLDPTAARTELLEQAHVLERFSRGRRHHPGPGGR